jgi:5-bromo-4-chloroindolyl phosphate hydrolysis protein
MISEKALETIKEHQTVLREYETARQALDKATRHLVAIERRMAQIELLQELEKKKDGSG